ncbi:MAG TPA: amidohydrolase family protein [Actinoplanes sp.]|nr:amidohydrolase family protein [Actinoplanes sp.]
MTTSSAHRRLGVGDLRMGRSPVVVSGGGTPAGGQVGERGGDERGVGEHGAAAVLAAEADRCLAHGITHAHDPYVSPDWHERMRALHATSRIRLSWATGSAAGMLSRPPGPATAPQGPVRRRRPRGEAVRRRRRAGRLPAAVARGHRPVRRCLRRGVADACRRAAAGSGAAQGDLRPRHLHTPYLRYTDRELTELIAAYAAAGLRLRIHALGNLAVAQAARSLRTARIPPGTATIDHLLLLDPATAELVAASGATASYQPGFIPRYGDMISATGTTRHLTAFGARLLLQAGVPLALSSDHPCGALDPLHNLRAAIDRRQPSGRALQPEQALTESEAVRAATVSAAASLGAPGAAGLAPGHPADLVVCDGDPFQPPTRVTQTWIAGRAVWRAPDQPRSHRR